MPEPMSEERLEQLHQMRADIVRQQASDWRMSYQEDIVDAVNEIDHLRAEVERLRTEVRHHEIRFSDLRDNYCEPCMWPATRTAKSGTRYCDECYGMAFGLAGETDTEAAQ